MSNAKKSQTPERKRKIYTAVLGGLLVAAVAITAVASLGGNSDKPIAQESKNPQGESRIQSVEESKRPELEDSQLGQVNQGNVDPNSNIEANNPDSRLDQAQESQSEDSQSTPVGTDPTQDIPWTAFDPAEMTMLWPVNGTVVKNYSASTLIYDETLDQYATNDSISISAENEETVLAAADGVVKEIGRSDRLGNYVVLDNGNGYETTYGQLTEDVQVTVGDTVLSGQTLGRIGAPSWYSVALGTHLTFYVSFNGTPVNPLDYLENVLED